MSPPCCVDGPVMPALSRQKVCIPAVSQDVARIELQSPLELALGIRPVPVEVVPLHAQCRVGFSHAVVDGERLLYRSRVGTIRLD